LCVGVVLRADLPKKEKKKKIIEFL